VTDIVRTTDGLHHSAQAFGDPDGIPIYLSAVRLWGKSIRSRSPPSMAPPRRLTGPAADMAD
jgi:hypothetical protein